jgi:hypothetical protein
MVKISVGELHAMAEGATEWGSVSGYASASHRRARLLDGFGPDADGEDPFDATIGLFGMLEVATGQREESGPLDPTILSLEGWMLGMRGRSHSTRQR